MRIVLGVGGGIAAYKVASLLRLFTEAGHNVTVIPTDAATRFVGVATWEALSGNPVSNSVFDDVHQVNHVRLGHEADLIVVAPATADLLARAATGQANDLLTNTLLMAGGPVLFAPAMHTEMWQHAATQANVETLRSRGVAVLEPASGRLTGSDSGPGRLPEPEAIYDAAMALVHGLRDAASGSPELRFRSPDGPSPSAPAEPASRWTRCGSWATALPASRASPWPRRPGTPEPPSGSWPPTWRSAARPASTWCRSRLPCSSGKPRWRRQPIPTSSSWPRRWRISARRTYPAPKSKNATATPTPSSRSSGTRISSTSS